MSSKIDKNSSSEFQSEREVEPNDSAADENINNLIRNEDNLGTHNQPKIIKIVKMVKKCKKRKRVEEPNNKKKTLSFRFYWREGCSTELFYGYRNRLKDKNGQYRARIYCNMQRTPKGQNHCLVSYIAKCSIIDETSDDFLDPKNWETEVNLTQPLHQFIRLGFFLMKFTIIFFKATR